MAEEKWNPWKVTAVGMAVVFATALITGIVVANWSGQKRAKEVAVAPPSPVPYQAARPSASDIEFCNQYARGAAGDKTIEVVKDALIGGAVGAAWEQPAVQSQGAPRGPARVPVSAAS